MEKSTSGPFLGNYWQSSGDSAEQIANCDCSANRKPACLFQAQDQ
ncbi:MAG TPA: hypothetical protein VGY55_08395 [Pirellulales bacterium]|jgi:hypothetical protein|nr:hypothetical protein [Pirellulales bacterium]